MKERIKDIFLIFVICGLFFLVWYLANITDVSTKSSTIDESTDDFITELDDFIANLDNNMDLNDAKNSIASQMLDLSKYYSEGELVGYTSEDIKNLMRDKNIKSTEDLKKVLDEELGKVSADYDNLINPNSIQAKKVTIGTDTVCSTYGSSSEYCLGDDKLNGYVYISSASSNKWVLLLHGNAGGGKAIYNQVGAPYVARGYNILAPDLRGHGKSGGVNSWGYLESLDAFDWIKWLDNNYNVDTLVVHGVSLGANTGMQLVTNPNFTADLRNKYHFKGLVEDSGYVSLTELIKGLINAGDTMDLDLFVQNTEEETGNFERNITSVINELGLSVDQKTISDLANGNISTTEFENLINNYINNRRINVDAKNYNEGNELNNSQVTDDVIKQYIIDNRVFGINSSNFDTYENVFGNGRGFRPSDKVLIIHSKTDDIINYRNAVQVSNKAKEIGTKFNFYWNVSDQPHAFILAGLQKEKYYSLVRTYLRCIDDNSYCADGNYSNYETYTK